MKDAKDIFPMSDAMHSLAGLLHRYIEVAFARMENSHADELQEWAKHHNLYHSNGHMYCSEWVVYAIHLILPRDHARSDRPFHLPEEARLALATTIELRLWLYFDPVDIRNNGNILSAHGALVHFLAAAEAFANAKCSPNRNCTCTAAGGCFPGKKGNKRSTLFGGRHGGGIYFSGLRALILLLRLVPAVVGLCETSESFFKLLKAMLKCTNKQWESGNVIKIIKEKLAGTSIDHFTNKTAAMRADKRLANAISLGTAKLYETDGLPWKNNSDSGSGTRYTFDKTMVKSLPYVLVLLFHLADYIYYQHNDDGVQVSFFLPVWFPRLPVHPPSLFDNFY
jgi:hypothetical protein